MKVKSHRSAANNGHATTLTHQDHRGDNQTKPYIPVVSFFSIEDLMFENQDLELSSLGAEDHSLHFFDQAPLIENEKDYFVDINETSVMRGNHSVQVKKGFDGTNYVIDLMVGCSDEKNVVK